MNAPIITIVAYDLRPVPWSMRIYHDKILLSDVTDLNYYSNQATDCLDLLAKMRDAGLIDLKADDVTLRRAEWAKILKP